MKASGDGASRAQDAPGGAASSHLPAEDRNRPRSLERLVVRVIAVLLFERAWQLLVPPVLVVGLFVCVSWIGLWVALPHWARMVGTCAFAIATLAASLPIVHWRMPSRREALARIDRGSGLATRPAAALEDRLANSGGDPATRALWALHRRRAEAEVAGLRVGLPSPRMPERDRYALRAVVVVGLVAAGFVAGPEKYARVAAAFDWRIGAFASADFRLDAWIDPPAYTGKPPIVLALGTNRGLAGDKDPRKVVAPSGSTVIVRASGGVPALRFSGALAEDPEANPAKASRSEFEKRLVLRGDARLELGRSVFEIEAIPDRPPVIELTDVPKPNARGSLTLGYRVSDDYGAVSAEAGFANPVLANGRPSRRSLVEAPRLALPLPPDGSLDGEVETIIDLSEHPWAGGRAAMTLGAGDAGGGVGQSATIELVLPQKPFTKPLAKALAEQRRNLVLAPEDKARVATALDALMIAPEVFDTSAGLYLGLHTAASRLAVAQTDGELVEVADLLWAIATGIENGDLSAAERDLRAAEQALREALARNASEDEIRGLMDNLRAAMDSFLREFAAQDQNRNGPDDRLPGDARAVDRKDLQAMLDKMEEMARSGAVADAGKMLEQLQNILENLRSGRPGKPDPRAAAMSRALDELGGISRDEQDLRDETHRRGQEQRRRERAESQDFGFSGPFASPPFDEDDEDTAQDTDPGEGATEGPGMEDLARRQQALRERLDGLQKRLNQVGQEESSLDGAQNAMRDAEKALNQGPGHGRAAVAAQGRALEALRQGAQHLAQALQGDGSAADGTEPGAGEGGYGGRPRYGRRGPDPLGRETGSERARTSAAPFDPLGVPASERARRVLEELRRRLGDRTRPTEELDYLERLLGRY